MAKIRADFVKETTTTTGTGNITLLGARNPARTFTSVAATSDTFKYAISHTSANEWEVGTGTMLTSTTFSRSVIASSNSNALVSFSAGTKNVDLVADTADLNAMEVAASDTVGGKTEYATTAETLTGTDATRSTTPDGIAALWEKGTDNSGGATITLGDGYQFDLITSTTTITALAFTTDKAGRMALLRFATARQVTHNATSLISPTGANLLMSPGECLLVESLGSGNFRIIDVLCAIDLGGRALNGLTANASATNATTNLSCSGVYTATPGSLQVGSIFEFYGYFVFNHAGTTALPTLTLELVVNGTAVDSAVVTPQSLNGIWAGEASGIITIRTTGASGTLQANCRISTQIVLTSGTGGNDGSTSTATDAIDTTVSRTMELRIRMTTAVASHVLTVTQGYVRKVR